MENFEERIEELKKKQEVAKELFLKLQGAIEVLQEIMKEKDGKKEDDKKV